MQPLLITWLTFPFHAAWDANKKIAEGLKNLIEFHLIKKLLATAGSFYFESISFLPQQRYVPNVFMCISVAVPCGDEIFVNIYLAFL